MLEIVFPLLYMVFYFYFSNRYYSGGQAYNLFDKISEENTKKTVLFEFVFSHTFFLLSLYYSFILFGEQINDQYIVYFTLGFLFGVFVVRKTSQYYINEGLIGVGSFIVLALTLILFVNQNLLKEPWLLSLMGFAGSLILLPTYVRFISINSKRFSIFFTLAFLSILLIFILLLDHFISAKFLYTLESLFLAIFITINVYLFTKYKIIAHWIIFESLIGLRYKIVYKGLENLEEESGLCLVSNHVSWLDWLILQLPIQRRVHYFINRNVSKKLLFRYFVRIGGCITMSKNGSSKAIQRANKLLNNHQIIGIFPEGSISKTGKLGGFKPGFTMLKHAQNSKIIPVYIDGLWGSIFSRSKDKFDFKKKSFRRTITVTYGEPLDMSSTVNDVKASIQELKNQAH